MMSITRSVAALSAVLLFVSSSSSNAETKIGFRQLGSTVPVAVQRGKKSEIKIRSNFTLDNTYAVFFDKPGMTAKILETKPIVAPRTGRGRPGTPFRFEVDVPADQEPGVYEIRVATKTAVSSVSHLVVSEYPVVEEEKKENGTAETAQVVPFPIAIAGMCEKKEDVDCYRIAGTAGQELTFQVYAQRATQAVHSMQTGNKVYLMDSLMTLYGPNGQVIAQNDNFIGGDSFIYSKLPETGDYTLEIRDARYAGDAKYVYCVEISDQPFAHTLFPMAVQRGQKSEVTVIGHILGDSTKSTVSIAADAPFGWEKIRVQTKAGETNPVSLLTSEYPQILASGSNHSVETAMPLVLPAGVNGRFEKPDGIHFYSFEGKKDQYYLFDVISNQRGLPLDSVIEITNAEGKKQVEADDGLQTKDSKIYFKAPADGKYYVSIRDLHDRGGERFVYHMRAEPSGPDFEVHGEYYYSQLAPGTRMAWFARINRLNGFKEPVEMQIEGLPEGVTFEPVTIPAGVNHCALILSAADDAKIGASLVKIYGKAKVAGPTGEVRELVRRGRVTCELQTQGGGQGKWPINTQVVGVTEPLDLLSVVATPSQLTLPPGGKAELKVRIVRNKEFQDPVTLAMAFTYFSTKLGEQLPPGVTVSKSSKLRLAGEILEGTIILEASDKAVPVNKLPLTALARVSITFSITTNYASNPIYLTVPEAAASTAKK